jgi:hypothetical protein
MENETMNITSATFVATMMPDEQPSVIQAVIDGKEWSVPMDPRNRHYKEILRQTKAGRLTIAEAEVSGE